MGSNVAIYNAWASRCAGQKSHWSSYTGTSYFIPQNSSYYLSSKTLFDFRPYYFAGTTAYINPTRITITDSYFRYYWGDNGNISTSNLTYYGTDSACAWQAGSATDQHSLGRIGSLFVPGPNVSYGNFIPAVDYNPRVNGTQIYSSTSNFTTGRTNYYRLRATTSTINNSTVATIQIYYYNTSGTPTVGSWTNWTSAKLVSASITTELPNRLILYMTAGGGGGYNGSSVTMSGAAGGGAGGWCAVVINTYWLKENTDRYYQLAIPSYAGAGVNGNSATLTQYSGSGTTLTNLIILAGGNVGQPTSMASGGSCTFSNGNGTYYWPLLISASRAYYASEFSGKAAGSNFSASVYSSSNTSLSAHYKTFSVSQVSATNPGACSLWSANNQSSSGYGNGGNKSSSGGRGRFDLYY